MKKLNFIILVVFALFGTQAFAHYMWVETNASGKLNEEQEVRVYFGEYTYGVIEDVEGEAFSKVNNFTLWLVDPSGNKTQLKTEASKNYYLSAFTPTSTGTYTILLNNNEIDVVDYTQYDFGIFKTHYHSMARVAVGSELKETKTDNPEGITLKQIPTEKDEVKLQVFYKEKPLSKTEAAIYVADLWSKKLETDENGFISFKLPWETKYIVEVTTKEETPGKYNGEDYEFVWHCVTFCLNAI